MKLRKLLLLTALFFSFNLLVANDYVKLYKNYIPETMLKNPANRADIERNFKTYLELDPSLVYYFIKTLNIKADSAPEVNWRQMLQKYFGKSKYLKQQWASVELYQINQKYEPQIKVTEISDYYSKFDYRLSKKIISVKSDPAEENEKNFYIYLYFSKSANIKYDPGKNYSDMLKPLVGKMIDTFNSKFENKSHLTKEELRKFIDTAFQYSYLFKNGYLDNFPQHTNFHIYELIAYYLKDDYINHNAINAHITYSLIPSTYNETFSFTDPFNLQYQYKYKIELSNTIYLNAGFRFKLKKLYSSFSFIDLSVGFAVQKSINNTFSRHVFFDGKLAVSGLSFNGSYYVSDFRDMKSMCITTQILTPVFYLTKNLYFLAGINYTLQDISFIYDFNRSGDVFDNTGEDKAAFFVDEEKKYEKKMNLIYPVISVNYIAYKSINVKLEYLIPKQARLGLGYYFNL